MSTRTIVLVVLAALLAGFLGNLLAVGGRGLYADWQFLRAARIQAMQQLQQRAVAPRPVGPVTEP